MQTLLEVYAQADEQTKVDGRRWYHDAYCTCRHLSIGYGRPLLSVVGAVAALSVGVKWEKNIEDAIALLKYWRKHKKREEQVYPAYYRLASTYAYQEQKAVSCVVNPPTSLAEVKERLGNQAWKTHSFAYAISTLGEMSTPDAIVIDRHMSDMLGHPNLRTANAYRDAELTVWAAANSVKEVAPQFQAITWLQWRRMK